MATRENGFTAAEPDLWGAARGKVDGDTSSPAAFTSARVKEEAIVPEETSTCGDACSSADVQLALLEEVLAGSGRVKAEPIEEDAWGPVASSDQWDPRLLPELAVKLEVNWDTDQHLPVGTVSTKEMRDSDGGRTAESAAATALIRRRPGTDLRNLDGGRTAGSAAATAPIRRRPGTDSPVAERLPREDMPPPVTTQHQCARCEDLYRLATPDNIAFLDRLLQCMRAVSEQTPHRDASGPATNGNHAPVGLPRGAPTTQAAKHDKIELVEGGGVLISKAVKRRLVLRHSSEPSALARALFAELVPDLKSVTAQGQRGKRAVPADVRHSVETFVTDIVEKRNRSSPTNRVALPRFNEIINRKAANLRRDEKRRTVAGYGRLENAQRADTTTVRRSPRKVTRPSEVMRPSKVMRPRKVTRPSESSVPSADTAVGPLPSPMMVSEKIKLN